MRASGSIIRSIIPKRPFLNSERVHMNHLGSSFSGKNSFWRYFIMLLAILAASNTIGSIPLFIAMVKKPEAAQALAANPNDLSPLGLDQNTALVYLLIPFIAGLLAFILFVKPLNHRTLKQVINGTDRFRWNRLFISAFIWTVVSAIYLFLNLKLDPSNFSLNNTSRTLIPLIIISICLVPFQAAFEEIIFRGYLMQGFTNILRYRLFPLVVTSVLFGLMHGLNPEIKEYGFWIMIPQYILFGLIFGAITIMDDGIEAAIGAHAANNAFVCIIVTSKAAALQTPAIYYQHTVYPWIDFFSMLVVGILVILIMKIVFRWGSFSTVLKAVERTSSINQVP